MDCEFKNAFINGMVRKIIPLREENNRVLT